MILLAGLLNFIVLFIPVWYARVGATFLLRQNWVGVRSIFKQKQQGYC